MPCNQNPNYPQIPLAFKVAIKKIPMAFEITPVAKRTLLEVKLLKHFNQHENVVSLLNIIKPPKPPEPFNDVYVILSLMIPWCRLSFCCLPDLRVCLSVCLSVTSRIVE